MKTPKYHLTATLSALSIFALVAALSSNAFSQAASSSSSSTSSSSSSSTSSSSGGVNALYWSVTAPICPEFSDATVIGENADGDAQVDPDNVIDAMVVYQSFSLLGGPSIGSNTVIEYANGSGLTLPMALVDDELQLIREIDFPPTDGWDDWRELSYDSYRAGQLNLVALSPNGGPNLGSITSTIIINTNDPSGWGGGYGNGNCPTTKPAPVAEAPAISCSLGDSSVWNSGYVLSNIVVTNTGDTAITQWDAKLRFNTAPQLAHAWNANATEIDNTIDLQPLSWNQRIEPGQSASFGLMGYHNNNFVEPTCTATTIAFEE